MKKKIILLLFGGAIFFLIALSVAPLIQLFLSLPQVLQKNQNINSGATNKNKINLNAGINAQDAEKTIEDRQLRIFYKTKPMVMFDTPNSEIVSFEAYVPVRYELSYGIYSTNENLISSESYQKSHEARIENLLPGTLYVYTVIIYDEFNSKNDEVSATFKTLDAQSENFSFVVLGDSRPVSGAVQPEVFSKIVGQIKRLQPNFVVMVGDMVQLSEFPAATYNEAEKKWANFLDVIYPVASTLPWYAAVGNHDEPDLVAPLQRYREIFHFPKNFPQNMWWAEDSMYFFEYGNALFVVVNTEEPGYSGSVSQGQYTWFADTLKKSSKKNKFVLSHRPFLGSKRKLEEKDGQDFQKLFAGAGVSAVFSGHDHLYCNYMLNGIYYIISGGAGSPLYEGLCEGNEISRYHFVQISVDKNKIFVKSFDENLNVLDSFQITK